ncbi:MAG: 3'-5' exonuclease [Anaerolineales bacterium]|nr:3'-5' exonuclease [Anaerolineales bacterium]
MDSIAEFYIVVDIEAAGPVPGSFAMLSLGAATLTHPRETFYIELQPDSENFLPDALSISGLSMQDLSMTGTPPKEAMQQFADWVEMVSPGGQKPVFTAFNAPFDWMFISEYFHRYLGYNPFGHKALDIKALFMGLHKVPFSDTSHRKICQHYNLQSSLSHHALEDAVQEADLLQKILDEIKQEREEKK